MAYFMSDDILLRNFRFVSLCLSLYHNSRSVERGGGGDFLPCALSLHITKKEACGITLVDFFHAELFLDPAQEITSSGRAPGDVFAFSAVDRGRVLC